MGAAATMVRPDAARVRAERLKFHRSRTLWQLAFTGIALAAAAPLALLVAPSPLRFVALAYGFVWAFFVLPPIGIYGAYLYDAVLMIAGHRPVFLPHVLAGYFAWEKAPPPRRALETIIRLSKVAAVVNPLTTTVIAALTLAERVSPRMVEAVIAEAKRAAQRSSAAADPSAALTVKVLDHVLEAERELVTC